MKSAEPDSSGYFGRNLDVFWDSLNGDPGWPAECELQYINSEHLQAFRSGYFLEALCCETATVVLPESVGRSSVILAS